MLPYLVRTWRRWRHLLFDHLHFVPFDDGHELDGWVNETHAESPVERQARQDVLHAIRDGHPSSPHFDPERHLHLVDRGGLGPRVDDEG